MHTPISFFGTKMNTIAGKQTLAIEGLHVRDLRKQVDSLKEFISTLPISPLITRWDNLLRDTSDSYFFTAFSEILSVQSLIQQNWTCHGYSADEKAIVMHDPSESIHHLLCIPILSNQDLQEQKEHKETLIQSLNALNSPYQIGLIIRTPLPNNIDWNELCTGLGKWLYLPNTVPRSFAYMRKPNPRLSLEFGVIMEKSPEEPNVLFTIQPFRSPIEWKQIYSQIQEYLSSQKTDIPKVISVVSNHHSSITNNHLLSLLYGPLASMSGPTENRSYTFDDTLIPGLFKENADGNVQSLIRFYPTENQHFQSQSFLNPHTQTGNYPSPYFCNAKDTFSDGENIFQWCNQP